MTMYALNISGFAILVDEVNASGVTVSSLELPPGVVTVLPLWAAQTTGIQWDWSSGKIQVSESSSMSPLIFSIPNIELLGNAGTINGVAITGTPVAGQVPTATSGAVATWQTPASGEGGGLTAPAAGLVKSTGTALIDAVAGTDYLIPGGSLGTPTGGTLTNCTFPTLNQNTTGSAGSVVTGGALNTPASGNLINCTFPTLNQSTTGTAAGLSTTLAVGSGGTGATTLTGLVKGSGTGALTAVAAPAGAVVGTTDTQTLTNKTLTAPTLTAPVLGTPASGTLTNVTGLPVGGVSATGTPSSTTYLRGDGTWSTPSASGGTATPTASTAAQWDANVNMSADVFIPGIASTATAAGTTTLTITSKQTQVFTGTSTQTVLQPTTSVPAGFQNFILNQSTKAVTVQSSAGNVILVVAPGTSASFTAQVATPTTAANWSFQNWGGNTTGGVIQMDSFSGTDDQKLAAAMAYASAQTFIPAIQLPARSVTFNTGGLAPYNGMRIIGPTGSNGPKNIDISSADQNHIVNLNVGTGTSAWFSGTATVYDVYIGDIAFENSGVNGQFWHQPIATAPGLYACQFHALDFYGFSSVFGNLTTSCAMTQVSFTGHWTVIAFSSTAMNLQYSDCSFWADSICNVGSSSTPATAGTPYIQLEGGKSRIGMMYLTLGPGWAGLSYLSGSGQTDLYSPIIEGTATTPATYPLIQVAGGVLTIHGGQYDYINPASGVNGAIQVSGGALYLDHPKYQRYTSTAATFPLVYQSGGQVNINDATSLQGSGEVCYWRQANGTVLPLSPGALVARVQKRVGSLTAPGATPTINTDNYSLVNLTGLATAITSMTTNLTGAPNDGDELIIRFTDNGTVATITHGAKFLASGSQALLTTTVSGKTHVEKFMWDATAAAWVVFYVDATGYTA
jgi:hypothetical protein